WFGSDPAGIASASRLWEILSNQAGTLELARTPLLLTFVCLVFATTQKLPTNRGVLYKKALDILLERWSAEKLVHNERRYEALTPEIEIEMLTDIAADAYSDDRIFMSQ